MLYTTVFTLLTTTTFARDPSGSSQCQSTCDPNAATNECANRYSDQYTCSASPHDSTCYICQPTTWSDPTTKDPFDPMTTPDPCPTDCETDDDCCGNVGTPCSRQCVDASTLTASGINWHNQNTCNRCIDTTFLDPVSTELPTSTMDKCPSSECSITQDCYSSLSGDRWLNHRRMTCSVDDSTGCGVCEELCAESGECQYPGHEVAGDCDNGQICGRDPDGGECGKCVDDATVDMSTTLGAILKSTIDCECTATDSWSCRALLYGSDLNRYSKYECVNIDDSTGCGECEELCAESGQCMRFGSSYECESGQICIQNAVGDTCGECVDIELGSTEEPLLVSTMDCECTERTYHMDCYDMYQSDTRYICGDIDDITGCGMCEEVTTCGECEHNYDCNQRDSMGGSGGGSYSRKYAVCEKDDEGCGECVVYDPFATTEMEVIDATDMEDDGTTTTLEGFGGGDAANAYGVFLVFLFVMGLFVWM